MLRSITILLVIVIFFGKLKSQDSEPFIVQFDKPLYTTGETAWFAVFRTDSISYESKSEVLHFELISPRNVKILKGKISFKERLADGYLKLPNDLDEGYYRFRAFTLQNLRYGGYYIYADIPVYSEWNKNLTVFKYEDELIEEVV